MTNGEKFCIDFPNIRIDVFVSYVQVVGENYEFNNLYPLKWWNSEYKEPTTKENLAVDCIDRKKLIDWINIWDITPILKNPLIRHIQGMSSVTPQEPKIGHCKNCKWWKDKDGVYRRGCRAESKCPINRREVFEGNGYCYMFEPQESEDKE